MTGAVPPLAAMELYEVDNELRDFLRQPTETYESYAEGLTSPDIRVPVGSIFQRANLLAIGTPQPGNGLRTTLGRAAFNFSHKNEILDRGAESRFFGSACSVAEHKLARSIVWNEGNNEALSKQRPALILLDDEAEPFGYLKCRGFLSAYTWRDAVMKTQSGQVNVPGNSFIQVFFGADKAKNPLKQHEGEKLIIHDPSNPDTLPGEVCFLRFSAFTLPRSVQETLLIGVAGPSPKLQESAHEALTMSAETIGNRVCELAARL
jgi:hypothetical protein